ncbi:hypothetical protein BT63DRAFT_73908 [Microthyrium microscopicum]|uniref:CipC-like antibiotic response protein n=1 Tax=Microthyrium microscopicum TaxID=703497 RepID=A0A6A6U0A0_9PEZI|nr:hypothetical protein BT63DRAFT_73908 [Microthyrium microscopicum]
MWGQSEQDYERVQSADQHNEGSFGHEVLAGAGSFAAFKVFEDHQRKEGKVVNHAFAKELLAGFVGGEVDKLVETKGMDWVDSEKAKHEGRRRAEEMYDQHYGNDDNYNPNNRPPPRELQNQYGNRW